MGQGDPVRSVVVLNRLAFSPRGIASQLALRFSKFAASPSTDGQGACYRFLGNFASIEAKPKQ